MGRAVFCRHFRFCGSWIQQPSAIQHLLAYSSIRDFVATCFAARLASRCVYSFHGLTIIYVLSQFADTMTSSLGFTAPGENSYFLFGWYKGTLVRCSRPLDFGLMMFLKLSLRTGVIPHLVPLEWGSSADGPSFFNNNLWKAEQQCFLALYSIWKFFTGCKYFPNKDLQLL